MNITLNIDYFAKKKKDQKIKLILLNKIFKYKKGVLRLTYSLTDDMTGSLFYEYRENDYKIDWQENR